jgi:hypothetical protein
LEPAAIDAHDRGLETKVSGAARTEIERLRLDELVREFQRLARDDRKKLHESYLARLALACNERRIGLSPRERRRRDAAIRRAEELTRSELELAIQTIAEPGLAHEAELP